MAADPSPIVSVVVTNVDDFSSILALVRNDLQVVLVNEFENLVSTPSAVVGFAIFAVVHIWFVRTQIAHSAKVTSYVTIVVRNSARSHNHLVVSTGALWLKVKAELLLGLKVLVLSVQVVLF